MHITKLGSIEEICVNYAQSLAFWLRYYSDKQQFTQIMPRSHAIDFVGAQISDKLELTRILLGQSEQKIAGSGLWRRAMLR